MRRRLQGYARGLTFLPLLGLVGCAVEPSLPMETGVAKTEAAPIRVAGGLRPLVTLLASNFGPTAPVGQQFKDTATTVNGAIPDNDPSGVSSIVDVDDAPIGSCNPLLDISVDVSITHPRPADLVITLHTIDFADVTQDRSVTLWNGPTATGAMPKTFPAASLIAGALCGLFELTVTDTVGGNSGTLNSWTLHRRVAWDPWLLTPIDYEKLLFDASRDINGYYSEISRGAFAFTNVGVIGPVVWNNRYQYGLDLSTDPHLAEHDRASDTISLLAANGFNFPKYDVNGDGRVDSNELEVLEIVNDAGDSGMNRVPETGCIAVQGVKVCTAVAIVAMGTEFETMAHEMSHSLGTSDLYTSQNNSQGLTLMDATLGRPLYERKSLYLDAWHRSKLGWLTPVPLTSTMVLGDETYFTAAGQRTNPAKLVNPTNANEYFLFEYRGQESYDSDASDRGIVVWHVQEKSDGSAYQGPNNDQPYGNEIYVVGPDRAIGGSKAWHAANGVFNLQWADGTSPPLDFWVTEPAPTAPNIINNMTLHSSSVCTPVACGQYQCGVINDGCGHTVDCTCPSGFSCGSNSQCTNDECTPLHCPKGSTWDAIDCVCDRPVMCGKLPC